MVILPKPTLAQLNACEANTVLYPLRIIIAPTYGVIRYIAKEADDTSTWSVVGLSGSSDTENIVNIIDWFTDLDGFAAPEAYW